MHVNRVWLAIMILTAFTRPALAGKPPAQSEPPAVTAGMSLDELLAAHEADPRPDLLFEIGAALFALGRFDEAQAKLESFLAQGEGQPSQRITEAQAMLYQIITSTSVHLKKGKELLGEGRYVEAGMELEACLEEEGDAMSGEKRAEVEALLDGIDAHVGYVKFSCNVAADIIVAGIVVGKCPIDEPVKLDEGSYSVRAVAPGYEMAVKVVEIEGGAKKLVKVVLSPQGRDACYDVTCSGHGTCVDIGASPSCECDAGFAPSGTGRECLLSMETPRIIRTRAAAGLAMTATAWTLAAVGGIMFGTDVFEAAIPLTAVSVLMFQLGVPVAVESYIQARRIQGLDPDRPSPSGYRAGYISLLSMVLALTPISFMGMPPTIIIASAHILIAGIIGTALGIKGLRVARRLEGMVGRTELAVLPCVTPLDGGLSVGMAGTF